MSKKSKKEQTAEIQAMKDFIQETFASFGATINFDSNEVLQHYSKGKLMSLDRLQNLQKGDVVWLVHKDGNNTRYRGAISFMDFNPKEGSLCFGDGSSFVTPVYLKDWEEADKTFYAGDDHRMTFYTAKSK